MVRSKTVFWRVGAWHSTSFQRRGVVSSGSRPLRTRATPHDRRAVDYLGIHVATLYDLRVDGVGPQAVKLGRALRYPESCVRTWIEEKLRG